MTTPVLSKLVRSTVAKVRIRGVPSLLFSTSKLVLGERPRLLQVARGFFLHLDPTDGDQCMMYYGLYGRGMLHFVDEILQHGDTAFDIGGQIGFCAGAFAQMVGSIGTVVTFEPDPNVWPRLIEGIHKNDDLPVRAKNIALSDETGEATLHVSPTAGWSTLLDCNYPEVEAVTVTTKRLDDLLGFEDLGWERLRLIKIDVEGTELAVLDGMREVLGKFRPYLICEMNVACLQDGGRTPTELLAMLDELGYTVQAIVEPQGFIRTGGPDLVDIENEGDLPWPVGDMLCTPRSDR
jgi:FkbM family methyltransferase